MEDGSSSQVRERRSKLSNERHSVDISRFEGNKFDDFKKHCKDRNILVERDFNDALLRKIEFKFMKDLQDWKWYDLLISNAVILPNCVRAFYFFGDNDNVDANGEKYGTKHIDQFINNVLGKQILINGDVVNDFLGLEKQGESRIPSNFDFVRACRIVYGRPRLETWVDNVKWLDVHTRFLHLMVVQALVPRSGNYTSICPLDMYLMCKIIEKQPPNLGVFIARRMTKAIGWSHSTNKYKLPYGVIVSNLVRKEVGRIPRNEVTSEEVTVKKIQRRTLLKMDFIEVDGKWVRKEEPQEQPLTMETMLATIMGKLDAMEERQVRIEAQLKLLTDRFIENDEDEGVVGMDEMED